MELLVLLTSWFCLDVEKNFECRATEEAFILYIIRLVTSYFLVSNKRELFFRPILSNFIKVKVTMFQNIIVLFYHSFRERE